jgi:F0F1-type ATP synthase membrane subunit a
LDTSPFKRPASALHRLYFASSKNYLQARKLGDAIMASPMEQFVVTPIIPLGRIGNAEVALTNSALFMIFAVAVIVGGLLWATRSASLVPSRSQAAAEMLHQFVSGTVRDTACPAFRS